MWWRLVVCHPPLLNGDIHSAPAVPGCRIALLYIRHNCSGLQHFSVPQPSLVAHTHDIFAVIGRTVWLDEPISVPPTSDCARDLSEMSLENKRR